MKPQTDQSIINNILDIMVEQYREHTGHRGGLSVEIDAVLKCSAASMAAMLGTIDNLADVLNKRIEKLEHKE